jgi:hypothetical protein
MWLSPALAGHGSSFFDPALVVFVVSLALVGFVLASIVNAALWAALSRMLHNLHDRGLPRELANKLAWLLIGLAFAPGPYDWAMKKLGAGPPTTSAAKGREGQ